MTFPVSAISLPSRREKSSGSERVEWSEFSGLELAALDERSMARWKNRMISTIHIEMSAQRMRQRWEKTAGEEEKNAKVKDELEK